MIGGAVVIAVIIAVVAIVVSSAGAKKSGLAQNKKQASTIFASVEKELAGIPQIGTTLGNPKAKVTIQYFGDLECPVCQAFTLGEDGGGLPQLIDGPVKAGTVKLVYRSMCTATCHYNTSRFIPQQVAAYAAGKQHLFWDYAELFYHEQGSEEDPYVTESYLRSLADQIPSLNFSAWLSERKDKALSAQVSADEKAASADGIDGTPTLVAVGKKEEIVPAATGIPTYAEIMSAVKAVSS